MYKDWIEFKKSFTQEQEDAIWQYFIDHSQVQKNGFLGIQLYVRDVNDMWKRIFARFNGDFQRYDKLEKENKQQSQAYYFMKNMAEKNNKIVQRIRGRGSFFDKLQFKAYLILKKRIFK